MYGLRGRFVVRGGKRAASGLGTPVIQPNGTEHRVACRLRCGSVERAAREHPAVDDEFRARAVRGFVGCEEQHGTMAA